MDTGKMPGTGDTYLKKVNVFRLLAQGEGMTFDRVTELQGDIAEAFDTDDLEVFAELLDRARKALPYSEFASAIYNALGGGDAPKSLTERRAAYLTKRGDKFSSRTLMRYEQTGAELLAKSYELVQDEWRRQQDAEASDDAARDADIEALRIRVSELEQAFIVMISTLGERITKLTARLDGHEVGDESEIDDWADSSGFDLLEVMQKIYIRQKDSLKDFPI